MSTVYSIDAALLICNFFEALLVKKAMVEILCLLKKYGDIINLCKETIPATLLHFKPPQYTYGALKLRSINMAMQGESDSTVTFSFGELEHSLVSLNHYAELSHSLIMP